MGILVRLQSHRLLLLRLIAIGGVVVVAPVIGMLVVRMKPLFVLIAVAAPLGLIGLQLILPRFALAPFFILTAAAFLPIELPTGTESRLVDSFLLTLLFVGHWLLKMIIVDKRLSLQPSPINKPLLGFIFVTLFSIIWSTVFRDPLVDPAHLSNKFAFVQIASALTMVMLPGAFLLVTNHVHNLKLLKAMVILMMLAGAISVIEQYIIKQKLVGVNNGGLFTMWVTLLGLGMGFFNREWSWSWRGLSVALGSAAFLFRFIQNITWLAGWLPPLIGLSVLIFMRSKKLFVLILLLGGLYIGSHADYYLGKVIEDEANESGYTRLMAWEVNWRVTSKHLLFGTGPAGYAAYYMSYFPDEAMATHNNLIDILAQTGIVGFTLCMWFFFSLVWYGYQSCLKLRGRNDFLEGLANIAFAGTISCTISLFFGDWLFPFTYTQTIAGFDYIVYSWLFMGTSLVIARLYQVEPEIAQHA